MKHSHKAHRRKKKVHLPEPAQSRSENETPRTPLTAGEGKSWLMLKHEYALRNPKNPDEPLWYDVVIPRGTPVHEKCHAAYWEAHQLATDALRSFREAGTDVPRLYVLINEVGVVVGAGAFTSGEDAHDMAWIACMFLEMRLRLGFGLPEGVTPTGANAQGAAIR